MQLLIECPLRGVALPPASWSAPDAYHDVPGYPLWPVYNYLSRYLPDDAKFENPSSPLRAACLFLTHFNLEHGLRLRDHDAPGRAEINPRGWERGREGPREVERHGPKREGQCRCGRRARWCVHPRTPAAFSTDPGAVPPQEEYTEEQYKALKKKIDRYLLPLMWLCYGIQQTDKTSIGTQATFGLREVQPPVYQLHGQ